jgi:transposase
VEGAHGIGRALAQRLVGDGEQVLDVPAKLAARVRVLSVGHGRKSGPDDAVSVAVAAWSVPQLRQVGVEDQAVVSHLLTKRRQDLVAARTQTINRLHRRLMDLVPGGRPAQSHRQARRRSAQPGCSDRCSGGHPLAAGLAARFLGEVGDVGRFPTKHHFAAHTGTAPLEVSSGQVIRHRLSRAEDRRLTHALYMMAMVRVRRPSAGQAYYRRKGAGGKSSKEALRCFIG